MQKLFIFLFTFIVSCTLLPSSKSLKKESNTGKTTTKNIDTDKILNLNKNEENEYDIIVFDPQYNVYLKTIAHPKEFHSEQYYRSKNIFYVTEWNIRNDQPFRYNSDLYSVRINYANNIKYGYELEYKLYNFFKFIEWKYKVDLGY